MKHIVFVAGDKDNLTSNPDNLWIEQMVMSLMKTNRAKVTTVYGVDEMESVIRNEAVDTIMLVSGKSLKDARSVKGLFKDKEVVLVTSKIPENEVIIIKDDWAKNSLVAEAIILN